MTHQQVDGHRTERIPYFDNLKFALIVLVVIGHYIDPFRTNFVSFQWLFCFIYVFHMPMFVFVTGLFARTLVRKDGQFRFARILQFLVLYLMFYSCVFLLELLKGKEVSFTPWSVSNSTWYFLGCVFWYAVVPVLKRFPVWLTVGVSVVIALVAGYFSAIGDFLSLSRVLCFAPFFCLGYGLGADKVAILAKARWYWEAIAALALAGAIMMWAMIPKLLRLRPILTARNSYESLTTLSHWGVGFRFTWYLAAAVLGCAVMLLVPRHQCAITFLGRNTLGVYIWHVLGLRLLALTQYVAIVNQASGRSSYAHLIPLSTAIVAAVVFSLPLFGYLAERFLKTGKNWVLSRTPAFVLAVIIMIATPILAFLVSM